MRRDRRDVERINMDAHKEFLQTCRYHANVFDHYDDLELDGQAMITGPQWGKMQDYGAWVEGQYVTDQLMMAMEDTSKMVKTEKESTLYAFVDGSIMKKYKEFKHCTISKYDQSKTFPSLWTAPFSVWKVWNYFGVDPTHNGNGLIRITVPRGTPYVVNVSFNNNDDGSDNLEEVLDVNVFFPRVNDMVVTFLVSTDIKTFVTDECFLPAVYRKGLFTK